MNDEELKSKIWPDELACPFCGALGRIMFAQTLKPQCSVCKNDLEDCLYYLNRGRKDKDLDLTKSDGIKEAINFLRHLSVVETWRKTQEGYLVKSANNGMELLLESENKRIILLPDSLTYNIEQTNYFSEEHHRLLGGNFRQIRNSSWTEPLRILPRIMLHPSLRDELEVIVVNPRLEYIGMRDGNVQPFDECKKLHTVVIPQENRNLNFDIADGTMRRIKHENFVFDKTKDYAVLKTIKSRKLNKGYLKSVIQEDIQIEHVYLKSEDMPAKNLEEPLFANKNTSQKIIKKSDMVNSDSVHDKKAPSSYKIPKKKFSSKKDKSFRLECSSLFNDIQEFLAGCPKEDVKELNKKKNSLNSRSFSKPQYDEIYKLFIILQKSIDDLRKNCCDLSRRIENFIKEKKCPDGMMKKLQKNKDRLDNFNKKPCSIKTYEDILSNFTSLEQNYREVEDEDRRLQADCNKLSVYIQELLIKETRPKIRTKLENNLQILKSGNCSKETFETVLNNFFLFSVELRDFLTEKYEKEKTKKEDVTNAAFEIEKELKIKEAMLTELKNEMKTKEEVITELKKETEKQKDRIKILSTPPLAEDTFKQLRFVYQTLSSVLESDGFDIQVLINKGEEAKKSIFDFAALNGKTYELTLTEE